MIREMIAVCKVIKSGNLSSLAGEQVKRFETEFAEYIGTKHAIAVNSGTSALHTSLLSMGICQGDEVIVPSYSFIATASSVLQAGAKPVFADIDSHTFNISPDSIKNLITSKTKAIIPVHLAGLPASMDEIKKNNLFIIEDACQAVGARYNGKRVGSIGDMGCFSFYPSKNIKTGEGGMITTNSDKFAQECKLIRNHGMEQKYNYKRLGWNYRMTEIQAAMGRVQLRKLDSVIKKKNQTWELYTKKLNAASQRVPDNCEPAFSYWIGRGGSNLQGNLLYPKPLHKIKLFKDSTKLPTVEKLCRTLIMMRL